jgi:hypothetical protein
VLTGWVTKYQEGVEADHAALFSPDIACADCDNLTRTDGAQHHLRAKAAVLSTRDFGFARGGVGKARSFRLFQR